MELPVEKDISKVKAIAYKVTVESLLSLIEKKAKDHPERAEESISDEIVALSELLGEVVERALDLVDNTQIKLYRSHQSGRELFEITGTPQPYLLFPAINYCSCRSYCVQVMQGEEYCCKHYLATRIARALEKVEVVEKSDVEFRTISKQINF